MAWLNYEYLVKPPTPPHPQNNHFKQFRVYPNEIETLFQFELNIIILLKKSIPDLANKKPGHP
jgi:hypothetical protein